MAALDEAGGALALEMRRKIYDQIREIPGIHFRDLQRKSRASTGGLDYHLHYMESRGLIRAEEEGKYTRYFVSGTTTEDDRKMMAALRIGGQRKILLFLLLKGASRANEVSTGTRLSKSTVSFHTKRLLAINILSKGGRCLCVENKERLADLLIRYKSSFFDSSVDRFAETWLDLK